MAPLAFILETALNLFGLSALAYGLYAKFFQASDSGLTWILIGVVISCTAIISECLRDIHQVLVASQKAKDGKL